MQPFVLIVDDEPLGPDHQLVTDVVSQGVDCTLVHPSELTDSLIERASVIAIDHFLETWGERDLAPTGLQVRDGMALASVLRSHRSALQASAAVSPNIAYVVRTNKLDELRGTLPVLMSQHVLAGYHGLDWLQAKGGPPATPTEDQRLASLARAVSTLPQDWSRSVPAESDDVADWLGLSDRSFRAAAGLHIEEAHPTAHRLAEQTSGSGFLRWFLQRVLPYPTFLIGDIRAALALEVSVDALDAFLNASSDIGNASRAARYDGQLAGFVGRRWWRAGLQQVSLEMRSNPEECEGVLADAGLDGSNHRSSEAAQVVVLDVNLEPKAEYAALDAAVRVQPDGWPSFAEDAWVSIADAQANPDIASAVVTADRWQIEDD